MHCRLTVIGRAPNAQNAKDTNARWYCKCECGKIVVAYGQDLKRGKVKSCGCLNAERIRKHSMSRTGIYNIWKGIRSRCRNPTEKAYPHYGGRGISVDPAWESFDVFLRDMGNRPRGSWIERVDNSGNYCKVNCRWATPTVNGRNRRNNHLVTAYGKTQPISQWAEQSGLDWYTIRSRLRYGWPPEDAVSRAPQPGKKLR